MDSGFGGSDTDTELSTSIPTSDILSRQSSQDVGIPQAVSPSLSHRLRHDSSILALALSEDVIYAGTGHGEILVYSLGTYEKKATIEGHKGSVLGLCLNKEQDLLFSSAGDRIVNAWSTKDYKRQFCLHSSYDVGDIFCVSYSPTLQTVYLGAQNTSIQWATRKLQPQAQRSGYFSGTRNDPFFDSAGPGGYMTPRQTEVPTLAKDAVGGEIIQIAKDNIKHFAHYGYVFCMQIATHLPEAGGKEVLVTGGGDGVVKLWRLDPETGGISELYTLDDGREEGHSILSLAIEGTFLYSGRSGGELDVWDLETRQLVRNLKAHRDDVLTICVGGGFMFSAAVTGFVRRFDNRQYTLKSRFQAHEGRILCSAFTIRKGRPIYVTGGNDNSVAIWNISDCVTLPVANAKTSNEQLIECLRRFVSYRTVSSDSRYQVDCRRGASYLRSVLKNFGATTEMLPTPEPYNPVIYARFRGNPSTAAKRKKILFYGHYDVVPADNSTSKWLIPDPFAMEGIDGYLYGRGTSDNKGPIMAAIFACAELLSSQQLESDIIFLIEGEEECGSRGFEAAVKARKEKIGDVDWILLANSYWLDDRLPCLTYGLRGVIHATVQIESSHPDLHSGVDGSRQLDESLKDLVMLLSKLTGKDGEVMIPGFYDPIPELCSEEAALYDEITAALVERNPNLGNREDLANSLMRRWREATLTIHRFQTSGPDNATIIPRLAKVALSMRLVPNQESAVVAKSLTDFLQSEFGKLGSNNNLTVTIDHQAEPWLGDWTNDLFKCLEEAIMDVWGPISSASSSTSSSASQKRPDPAPLKMTVPDPEKSSGTGYFSKISPTTSSVLANGSLATPSLPPMSPLTEVSNRLTNMTTSNPPTNGASSPSHSQGSRRKPLYIREGGSIPAIRFLEQTFNAPAAHLPCGQASDSAHLDSERLRLRNLYAAKRIFGRVFGELPRS